MPPFTNAHHGGEGEPFDLAARIEAELRTRIEDAVDHACLEAMVRDRETRRERPPAADNTRDREEFMARVRDFLRRLRVDIVAGLSDEQHRRLGQVIGPAGATVEAEIVAQVALARELPDYWQRFEALRLRPPAEPSGGEPRGLLDRLRRRG